MTTIRIASDLHLEFFRNVSVTELERHFLPEDPRDSDAVLTLAGDISSDVDQLADFLASVSRRFKHVIYVPGNHEFYRSKLSEWQVKAALRLASLAPNVHTALISVGVCKIGAACFIFGTLWGDGGDTDAEREAIGNYLNDFRLIRFGGGLFTVPVMAQIHRKHKRIIECALDEEADDPAVVITHHMPSYALSHPRFGNVATGGFAGKCDALMEGENAPVLWIHGHTHDSIDRVIGRTRVVCNPAGYVPEWQTQFNSFFAAPKFVEAP